MKTRINKQLLFTSLLLLSISITFAQYGNKKIKGNGKMTTITKTTGDYKSISCAGPFNYILVAGEEGEIIIEGEENLLEHIVAKIKNGNLIIKVEDHKNLKSSINKGIKIIIPFKDINAVSLAGSGDLWNTDKIKTTDLKVTLAGSGDIVLDVETLSVEGSVASSGNLTLTKAIPLI